MSSGIARKASHIGKQAIVIGAGISGLAAARALADHFDEVVVLESGQFPAVAAPRPGAPQGKQVHGLLGGAMKALEDLFPDFAQDLANAGAVRVNPGSEILQEMPGMDRFPLCKWDWCIYTLTRPLIEQTLRRRVERHTNISLRGGCRALGIVGILDELPGDGDEFLAYAQNLPTYSVHNAMKGAKRLSEVARYGFPESRWRHFAQLDPFPQNLLPIGDAICCLNPIYGQGITVAVQEANILRRLLSANAAEGHPLAMLAQQFLTKAEALVKEPWAMSAIPDFIYPQTRGERPADLEQRLNSQVALTRLATRHPAVWKLMSEVRHLLKPLAALEDPGLAHMVEMEMATV